MIPSSVLGLEGFKMLDASDPTQEAREITSRDKRIPLDPRIESVQQALRGIVLELWYDLSPDNLGQGRLYQGEALGMS